MRCDSGGKEEATEVYWWYVEEADDAATQVALKYNVVESHYAPSRLG